MSDSTHDTEGPNMWTQSRFVIAAVVVALIAVMAVVLAVSGPGGNDSTASPTPTVTESSTPRTSASTDSVCGLEPGDQTVPAAAPEDTEWELVGTVAAPTAPEEIGPGVEEDGLRSCFARSPLGALYAAANLLATTSNPDQREALVRELTAEGPARQLALELLAAEGQQAASNTKLQVAGFTFLNYDRDNAVVDLATRVDSGALAHISIALTWEAGDWKLVLAPDGRVSGDIGQIPDLTGYVPWGGA